MNNIDQILIECARQYHIKDGFKILDYTGDEEVFEAVARGS